MTESGTTAGEPADLEAVAARHGVSLDAVRHLRQALRAGHGTMAQFDHPDLGGFGQWSAGGMVMVGRMFDDALKARVGALCAELAGTLGPEAEGSSGGWWPAGLGRPGASGAQGGTRYAYFPETRRLAVETGGRLALYDTGDHDIGGVSQQQGAGAALRFTGRGGEVDLAGLRRVEDVPAAASGPRAAPGASPLRASPERAEGEGPADDPLATLRRLADLHREGVLTDAEFADKKADLLKRV